MSPGRRYESLGRFLLETDPVKVVQGGWDIVRVGRNPVWRARAGGRVFFVKIMEDPRYYQRERHGLEISQHLAAQHDWINAPELVHSDEMHGVLITSALPGLGVGKVFRSAFRMDRNPFRRQAPIEEFLRALSHVLRWLAELHRLPVTCGAVLFDHSCARTRDRVLSKLRRAVEHDVLDADGHTVEQFGDLDVSASRPGDHLICGDATLGNFLWDGERIGRVDFEDFGYGSPARDYSEIRQGLESTRRKPWYWGVDQATALLPPRGNHLEDTLYRLEWSLDRHWPGGRRKPTRRMRALERDIRQMLESITG